MPRTQYDNIMEAMPKYDGMILHAEELRKIAAVWFGSDERTIVNYLKLMSRIGILQEVEHLKFKVDMSKDVLKKIEKRKGKDQTFLKQDAK